MSHQVPDRRWRGLGTGTSGVQSSPRAPSVPWRVGSAATACRGPPRARQNASSVCCNFVGFLAVGGQHGAGCLLQRRRSAGRDRVSNTAGKATIETERRNLACDRLPGLPPRRPIRRRLGLGVPMHLQYGRRLGVLPNQEGRISGRIGTTPWSARIGGRVDLIVQRAARVQVGFRGWSCSRGSP